MGERERSLKCHKGAHPYFIIIRLLMLRFVVLDIGEHDGRDGRIKITALIADHNGHRLELAQVALYSVRLLGVSEG